VLVTNGGKQAVYNAFATLLDPGDEVLLPGAVLDDLPRGDPLAGGVPSSVPTDETTGYLVTVEQLEAARTPRTKVLLFVSPSNPTGAVYPREPRSRPSAAGRSSTASGWSPTRSTSTWSTATRVLLDAGRRARAGRPLRRRQRRRQDLRDDRLAGRLDDRPADVIKAATNLQSHATSNVANVVQRAALAAVSGDLDGVAMMREAFDRRRSDRAPAQRDRRRRLPEPEGAFYATRRSRACSATLAAHGRTTSPSWPTLILDEAEVAVVPGRGVRHARLPAAVLRPRRRRPGRGRNVLVAVPATGGAPIVLWSGADFVSSPVIDPETSLLAWVSWDHPHMPWDTTRLWVGHLDFDDPSGPRLVDPVCAAGGDEESISQPEWDPSGRLWFISDRSDWWNLWHFPRPGRPSGEPCSPDPRPVEVGVPAWNFGVRRYAFLSDGRAIAACGADGIDSLVVLDTVSGRNDPIDVPLTSIQTLAVSQTTAVMIGASFTSEPAVHAVLVGRSGHTGGHQVVRPPRDLGISSAYVSIGQPISYPTSDGARSHAIFYPPTNPDESLIADQRPPALVMIHGGPVAAARPELRMAVQFWTSRGWAVIDVNHRGSTGYGRRYRTELRRRWGVVDVGDAADAVRHLAASGRVDPERAVIRGGSAGGFTTLLSVAVTDVYAAGASYYGIADLAVLSQETHKFESHDVDILIGPWPDDAEVYRERSPLFRAADIDVPVIVFQGTDDVVVPPVQAELIVSALRDRGVPHAYVVLEGEGHGFRRQESITSTLAAEWSFYAQVLGLTHPDDLTWHESWSPKPSPIGAWISSARCGSRGRRAARPHARDAARGGRGRARADHPVGHQGDRRGARGRLGPDRRRAGPASGSTTSTPRLPPSSASWW
jgi:dipeptidyl aminopeptidase/acylaminoacyl peptidase